MNTRLISKIRKFFNPRAWASGLFWSWNLIFLAFMLLGFAPKMLPELLAAVRLDQVPPAFLIYAVILTAIPVGAVLLGLTLLRGNPAKQFSLGYGVEGPLMLLVGLRFFAVRELTPALALLLAIACLGIATYLWQVLDRNIERRRAGLLHVRFVGLTLLLLTGLYASVWLAFYAIPLGAQLGQAALDFLRHLPEFLGDLWEAIRRFEWRHLLEIEWGWVPFLVLGSILLGYTATLVVAMPVAVLFLYGRVWWQGLQTLVTAYNRRRAFALTAIVLAVCLALFVLTNQQPQHRAFALLETQPTSRAEAETLLSQQKAIRSGLLNAYLASFRYFSAVGEVRHVSEIYQWGLNMPPQRARRVQNLYENVARPVLYVPVNPPPLEETGSRWDNRAFREEPVQAAELYESFFDRPILEGEHEAVVRAVRSTWSIDQAQAAWLAVDDREIHLNRQEVTVAEHNDWAEVELYEVYQNQTGQRQEVVYYFSLPESAVITGLWLGHSAERDERFEYRVSPRGAAQALYRNEVNYNRDPALVEQIGPRQYRLRVFPVEPETQRWDDSGRRSNIQAGPPLFMWLTYRVLAQDNTWTLPRLAEKRNVYWDDNSVRLINGQPLPAGEETWLPPFVTAAAPVEPAAHQVDFPGGHSVLIRPVTADDLPQPAANLNLAVVLDRSRSMAGSADEVSTALARLAEVADTAAAIDVYLTSSPYRGEEPSRVKLAEFDPDSILYYGGQNAAELLVQFDTLQTGEAYDAIFVLTDSSGYELTSEGIEDVPIPAAPVWLVHLGGDFPLGYDDDTLQAIQASGGGVAGSVDEALTRLAVALEKEQDSLAPDVIDGYTWSTVSTKAAETGQTVTIHQPSDDFAAFAARRVILAEMARQRGQLAEVDTLDRLHAIAVEHSLVTPYSSMIVVVTREQAQRLKLLEANRDRFQREYEDVGETNPENPFDVTGVPEPEEWLLLGLAVGMLGWYVYTNRRQLRRGITG